LIFTPRFPLQPGLAYRLILNYSGDKSAASLEQEIAIPVPAEDANRKAAQVQRIFPSSDELPENHLRFYIQFSQPMSRTVAYQNLELLDDAGKAVEAAFLELGEELWDPSGQRLTLLLDPGRIKRGLVPREEDGPILVAGRKYILVVKQTWRDARGKPLKSEFRKSFTAGLAREEPLDTADWVLKPPTADGRAFLSLRFPYPLDYALLNRLLSVVDSEGKQIDGETIVCGQERQWTFRPDDNWRPGRHYLVVDTVLEDSAGNRIGRAFEVDQVEEVKRKLVPEYVKIPFEVKEPLTKPVVGTGLP
jgi:hypothetical protein